MGNRVDSTRNGVQEGGDTYKGVSDSAFSGSTETMKPKQETPGKMDSDPSSGGSASRGQQG